MGEPRCCGTRTMDTRGIGARGLAGLLAALVFAADKHSRQRRKDSDATPYINHPISVAEVLARVGGVTDLAILQAAVLHDTLEDTQTTPQELRGRFGQQVCALVQELTDDRRLPKEERKRLQVEHAPRMSAAARQIKVADKICNLMDMTSAQPPDWTVLRKQEYLEWAARVVAGCRRCRTTCMGAFGVRSLSQDEEEAMLHPRRVRTGVGLWDARREDAVALRSKSERAGVGAVRAPFGHARSSVGQLARHGVCAGAGNWGADVPD